MHCSFPTPAIYAECTNTINISIRICVLEKKVNRRNTPAEKRNFHREWHQRTSTVELSICANVLCKMQVLVLYLIKNALWCLSFAALNNVSKPYECIEYIFVFTEFSFCLHYYSIFYLYLVTVCTVGLCYSPYLSV